MALPASRTYPRPVAADQVARDVEEIITVLSEGASADVSTLRFFAGDMHPMSGSPGYTTIGDLGVAPSWGMPKSGDTTVGVGVSFPSTWATYDIHVVGAPKEATGGVVALRHARVSGGIGDNLAVGATTGQVVTIDVGATAGVLSQAILSTGVPVPGAGGFAGLQIARRIAEASDTFTGRWDLFAVVLTKAS